MSSFPTEPLRAATPTELAALLTAIYRLPTATLQAVRKELDALQRAPEGPNHRRWNRLANSLNNEVYDAASRDYKGEAK